MTVIRYVCLVLLSVFQILQLSVGSVSHLRKALLKNYTKDTRPVLDEQHSTTIKFGWSLLNVNLNDAKQSMEVVSILHVSWTDEYLQWNEEAEEVPGLHFDRDEIWMPDIALFNSAKGNGVAPKSQMPLYVLSSGTVLWLPPFNAEVPCQINLFAWPQDTNSCTFRFGSWAHHGEQLNIQLSNWVPHSISLSKFEQNNKWKLVNYSSERQYVTFEEDEYIHIDFNITVQREASAHVSYVTHTALAVLIAVLSAYLLPLRYHLSRLLVHLFGLSVLILCDVVLYLSIPATGGPIPHIVRYYSGTIILTSMSLLCNVAMTTTMHISNYQGNERKATAPAVANQEVRYMALNEELSEINYNPNHEGNHEQTPSEAVEERAPPLDSESWPTAAPVAASTTGVNCVSRRNLHRTLNILFFCMYSLAYIIDYLVMKSSISG